MLLPLLSVLFPAQDDSELILRLKRRDAQAIGDLYDQFGSSAYAIIVRIVKDARVAEDLLLETFFKLWNRVVEFENEGALGPWVATVARNRAVGYCYSTEGRLPQARHNIERLERPRLFADFGISAASSDQIGLVRQALRKLDENQRRILELAYFEGLSQNEIAARLQHPLGAVKAWARSALQVLREELSQSGSAPPS